MLKLMGKKIMTILRSKYLLHCTYGIDIFTAQDTSENLRAMDKRMAELGLDGGGCTLFCLFSFMLHSVICFSQCH